MKPPGSVVKLGAEPWSGDPPEPGDILVTGTGRAYLIDEARPGRRAGRYNLICVVLDDESRDVNIAAGARVIGWLWNKR